MKLEANTLKNNLTNPARPYMWELVFPNVIGGGDAEALTVRAQSTSIPGRSIGTFNIPFKASAGVQYPSKINLSHSWTVTFVEGEDAKIRTAIKAWLDAVLDAKSNISQGDDNIKANIYIRLIKLTGQEQHREFILEGCFPVAIADSVLDNTTEDAIKYEVAFSYDNIDEA